MRTSPTSRIATAVSPSGSSDPAYLQVASELRTLVLRRTLVPGERLPTEQALGELFGVGRSTVREAIRVLASEDLVEVVRGSGGGTFVRQPKIQDVVDRLHIGLSLIADTEECSVDELVEARKVLEVFAASAAAASARAEDVQALLDIIPAANMNPESGRAIFESNFAFHMAVLDAARNRVVRALAEPVFSALHSRVERDPRDTETWNRVANEHRGIVRAIQSRDGALAAELMTTHIECLKPIYRSGERVGR